MGGKHDGRGGGAGGGAGGKTKVKQGEPPIKRLMPLLQFAGVASFAAVVLMVITGLTTPIQHLSTYSTDQMKEVFLGDDTWMVVCSNTSDPIPDRFNTAAKELAKVDIPLKFGVLDCSGTLPSGKNVYTKFGIKEVAPPADKSSGKRGTGGEEEVYAFPPMFMVGPGLRPQQVYSRHLQTQTGFNKWIRATAENTAIAVSSTRELESRCLKKSGCAVILKAGQLEDDVRASLKHAMYRHRMLRFVHIDTTKHELSLEKKLGLKPPPQPPASSSSSTKKKKSKHRTGSSSSSGSSNSRKSSRKVPPKRSQTSAEVEDLDDLDDDLDGDDARGNKGGSSGGGGGTDEGDVAAPLERDLDSVSYSGRDYHRLMYFEKYHLEGKGTPKVGTPRWGLKVYEGDLGDGPAMVEWLNQLTGSKTSSSSSGGGGSSKKKDKSSTSEGGQALRPVTRLPTVMTRKWPKPVPPKTETMPEAGSTSGDADSGAVGTGGDGLPNFGGRIKEELIEELRKRQAEKERLKRAQMDEENWLFENDEDGERESEEGGSSGGGDDGDSEGGDDYDEEEVVDLDLDAVLDDL